MDEKDEIIRELTWKVQVLESELLLARGGRPATEPQLRASLGPLSVPVPEPRISAELVLKR